MLKIGLSGRGLVLCFMPIILAGCGGGGETTSSFPVIQASPMVYSFGEVPLDNSPAENVIVLSNIGSAPLKISKIVLPAVGFILDLNSGVDFCGSETPTIVTGGSCAVMVGFNPTTVGSYNGTMSISSNDPYSSIIDIQFTGVGVDVPVPTVHINQVEPDGCSSSELSVYLSVTDQTGDPISGLSVSNFTLSETFNGLASSMPIKSHDFIGNVSAPISVALVMDYSGSITDQPDVLVGMEEGVIHFINQLSPSDSAEIVKFDSAVEVVQPFVAGDDSGKALLIDKVEEAWDYGRSTRLYDAIYQAVEDLSFQHDARRAVILLTDGVEYINEGDATSEHTFFEVKNYAISTGVPVFTIGIGTGVDEEGINSLANDTGGQYFDTLLAGHLSTIYQQLAQILFVDQYLLICDSVFTSGDSVILNARVTLSEGGIGEDSRTILPCP